MLIIKRYALNTQYLFLNDEDYKNEQSKEIERVILHDGTNILSSSRWLTDLKGHSIEVINFELNAKRKNTIDLNEKAFIIKTSYEYANKNELTYDLYLHIDLFKIEVKETIKHDMLYTIYKDIEKNVIFETMTKLLRKQSSDLKSKIYNDVKELKTYNIDLLEKDVNNLKRNIKKYQSIYETETQVINDLKNNLK
jgi:hypothetical protein